MQWFTMGVDLGSTTAKAAIVDKEGNLLASTVVSMGAVSRKGVQRAIEQALDEAGLTESDIVRMISTGYGRKLVAAADKSFTEITCHARGAAALAPGVQLVIDIGGQDSKAIAIDEEGLVDRFALNDRCASGTGRFFDVLSRALEVELEEVVDLALTGDENLEVSSMCATFAETEVISLLAQGAEPADISHSVHRSVASRTLGLVAQVGKQFPAVMTGGVAKNKALVQFLSKRLGEQLVVLDNPQIAGALGAALIARDEYQGQLISADVAVDKQLNAHRSSPPPNCAACNGDLDHEHNHDHSGAPANTGPVPVILQMDRLRGASTVPGQ